MENKAHELALELVEELCHLYQEQERTRALNLDVCDCMLSSGNRSPREWVKVGDPTSEKQAR
ncbi:MAG TPA: hypothetical protein VH601_15615 [Bryobacteraceae bacterium]